MPISQSGNLSRNDGGDYVLASDSELPWAMYSVAMTDPQRPVSIDVTAAAAPLHAGDSPQPLLYYVASSDYSRLAWEWSGPYSADSTILLNTASVTTNPRRTSPSDKLYFVIAAGAPAGQPPGPAAVSIKSIKVNTSSTFTATLPGAVIATVNQGNDRGQVIPQDAYSISVHWNHVAQVSTADLVNIAQTYYVYRRSPSGNFVHIGNMSAPNEVYVDPLDNDPGVHSPLPNTTYDYYVVAWNLQGFSEHNGFATATAGDLAVNGQWTTERGNNARTGYNPAMAINGLLQPKWTTQTQIGQNDRFEPVLTEDYRIVQTTGSQPRMYDFATGDQTDSWPGFTALTGHNFPTVFGNWLALPADTDGLYVLDLPSGEGAATATHLEGAGPVSGSPLYMDGDIVFADKSGLVMRYKPFSATPVWQFNAAPASPFILSPAASSTYIYAADNVGRVFKIDASTGEQVDSVSLNAEPLGDSIALDVDRNLLWVSTDESCLVAISTLDMTVLNSWPDVPVLKRSVAPCIVGDANPPLVAVAYATDTSHTKVLAVNPDTMLEAWNKSFSQSQPYSVSACSDAIFLVHDSTTGGDLSVLSMSGALVQSLSLGHTGAGSAIPLNGQVIVPTKNDPYLKCFDTKPLTRPIWVDEDTGGIGIRNWECAGEGEAKDDMRVAWYDAYHPDGLPVKYALFYSAGHPPMVDAPYTDTTIISELTAGDNNTTLVNDLPLGVRYYAAVRAYVGTWGVDQLTDLNTVSIGSTPPWHERALVTGTSVLPSQEIGTFAITPGDTGDAVYMIASEAATGKMWNFWRTSLYGNFDYEGSFLNGFNASAVSASWYNQLYAARAGGGTLSVLSRISKDSWDPETVISGAQPDPSPAVSLAMGSQSGLGYTQLIGGSEPTSEVDYYAVRNNGAGWGSPEVVESNNVSGSDLDVALDPSNPSKLWVAYEKGTTASSALPTCLSGELWFARGNGGGGYSHELVDSGSNGAASDCGKRVKMVVQGTTPHLAYFDLNAANTGPRAQLKYAFYDGSTWQVSVVKTFDTSTQLNDFRATYSELGLAMSITGPVIAMLERQQFSSAPDVFTTAVAHVFSKNGASWDEEIVSDPYPLLTKDREPCELVSTPGGFLDLFFVAPPSDSTLDPGKQIVFLRRLI